MATGSLKKYRSYTKCLGGVSLLCLLISVAGISQKEDFARIYREGPQNDYIDDLKIIDDKAYHVVVKACESNDFCAALLCTDLKGDTLWYQDYDVLNSARSLFSDIDSSIYYWGSGMGLDGFEREIIYQVSYQGVELNRFEYPIAADTLETYSNIRVDEQSIYLTTRQGIPDTGSARWFIVDKLDKHTGEITHHYSMQDTIEYLRNTWANSSLLFNDSYMQIFDYSKGADSECPDGEATDGEAHMIFVLDKQDLSLDTIIDRCYKNGGGGAFKLLNDSLFVHNPNEPYDPPWDIGQLSFKNTDFEEVNRVSFPIEVSRGFTEIYPVPEKEYFIASGRLAEISPSWRFIPWISKINYDGEIIWEHFYTDNRTNDFNFMIPIELYEDDLYFGGIFDVAYPENGRSRDRAFIKLDSMGCFNGNCDLFIELGDTLTSIDDIEVHQDELLIFPNPSHGSYQIRLPESSKTKASHYAILDVKGNELVRSKISASHDFGLDITEYSASIYILVIYDRQYDILYRELLMKN